MKKNEFVQKAKNKKSKKTKQNKKKEGEEKNSSISIRLSFGATICLQILFSETPRRPPLRLVKMLYVCQYVVSKYVRCQCCASMIIGFSEKLQRSYAKEGSLGDSLFHIPN